MIRFTVPTVPIAQPRQRTRGFIDGAGRARVQNFTPTKHPVNSFKAAVQLAASQVYSGPPLEGPVSLSLVFVFPRPGRLIWKKRPMPRLPHTSRPDIENIGKAVFDSLTGTLFRDDAQIVAAALEKTYAAGDEQPHVEVEVREWVQTAEAVPA
jgi:Holliday junction resolvase RusA-like endonuclease